MYANIPIPFTRLILRRSLPQVLMAAGFLAGCGSTGTVGCIDEAKIEPGPCTKEYRPVCGCDGTTYGNTCEASLAGVTSWKEGSCED